MSPSCRKVGGVIPFPTPLGVPVAIISPGSNVCPLDKSEIILAKPNINLSVESDCLTSPLTLVSMWKTGSLFALFPTRMDQSGNLHQGFSLNKTVYVFSEDREL